MHVAAGDLHRAVMLRKYRLELFMLFQTHGIHRRDAGLKGRVMHEDQHWAVPKIDERDPEPLQRLATQCTMGGPFDQRIETQNGCVAQILAAIDRPLIWHPGSSRRKGAHSSRGCRDCREWHTRTAAPPP